VIEVTEAIRRKNFLAVEGRLLAAGEQSQITAGEWLYLYYQSKDDLIGVQVSKMASFKARIGVRYKKAKLQSAAIWDWEGLCPTCVKTPRGWGIRSAFRRLRDTKEFYCMLQCLKVYES